MTPRRTYPTHHTEPCFLPPAQMSVSQEPPATGRGGKATPAQCLGAGAASRFLGAHPSFQLFQRQFFSNLCSPCSSSQCGHTEISFRFRFSLGKKEENVMGSRVTNTSVQRLNFTRFLLGKMLVPATTAQAAHLVPKAGTKHHVYNRITSCWKLMQALLTHGQALHCSIVNDVGSLLATCYE